MDNTIQLLDHFLRKQLGQEIEVIKLGYQANTTKKASAQGTVLVEFPQGGQKTKLFVGGVQIPLENEH